jgi:hypothetical protein
MSIKDVRQGDLIESIVNGVVTMSEVLFAVEREAANETFITITTSEGSFTTTADHGLLALGNSSAKSNKFKLFKARSLKPGAALLTKEGHLTSVQLVTRTNRSSKITLATRSGNLFVNGHLVSTICGDMFEDGDDFESVYPQWLASHELDWLPE